MRRNVKVHPNPTFGKNMIALFILYFSKNISKTLSLNNTRIMNWHRFIKFESIDGKIEVEDKIDCSLSTENGRIKSEHL